MNQLLEQIEDMINLQRHRYFIHVDECANVHRRLLDKQDQLCMIHEQYNRHEK
jgi:hypothetical protein